MKKIYTLCAAALVAASTATAQQLPDGIGTFDGAWEDCYPNAGDTKVGKQPAGWGASNVDQMLTFDQLVTQGVDRTSTESDTYSVHLLNYFCGLNASMGATAPAYITIGSAWNYGDGPNLNTPNDKSDGGSYGGIEFGYRPDAVSMWIKRVHKTELASGENGSINANEKATILAYAWKGETSSTVKVGLDYKLGIITISEAEDRILTNRDKDVLGMVTDGVTKSKDFELISKSENYIEGDIAEWTQKVFPIEYFSDNAPEMLNIVIATSDYFNRANLGVGNTLDVDDVTLVYYSTLSSLTIGGNEIALTDGTYEYEGSGAMPASTDEVEYTTKGRYADAEVSIDEAARTVTITVTNQGGADLDGETSHTYTVTYPAEPVVVNTAEYMGYIATYSYGEPIGFNEPKSLVITTYNDGSCTVAMPEVNIQGIGLGDITIPAVVDIDDETGTATYTGSVTLEEVMGQTPVVTLNGSISLDEETTEISVEMNFDIAIGQLGSYTVTFTIDKQVMYTEPYEVYQNVTLNGEKTVTDEAVELEIDYYGDGTCLLTAPMNVTFEGWEFGDILGIDNIAMTVGENGTTLAASEEDEFEGSHASVVLDGTIGNDGKVNIKVVLTVDDQTATITYTTDKLGGTTSVEDIYAGTAIYGTEGAIVVNGYNGTALVYATDGSLVKSVPVDGEATILIGNGIYIVRIADAVEKVMVK